MSYKYKLLLMLLLTNKIIFSNLARHDIDWEDYEDFSMNRGKYAIGRMNVIVYKKDGSLSGKIDKPIPNFDSVVDTGNFALWGDPQILSGVYHVTPPEKFTFSKRHFRNDVELFEGYKELSLDKKYEKFSEDIKSNYRQKIEKDYTLLRTDRIAFDAHVIDGVTEDQWNKIKYGDLVARVGRGLNAVATDYGVDYNFEEKFHHFAGGLNKVEGKKTYGWRNIQLVLSQDPKTPLDTGTKKGDSGSPLFWWDEEKKKWFMAASHSGSTISGYGKRLYLLSLPRVYDDLKKNITDKEITTETDVKFEEGKLKVNNEEREFREKETDVDVVKGTNKTKNQIFNKKDLEVKVNSKTNTHYARLEFKQDTTLSGDGELITAGFVVHKDATLTYKLHFGERNIVRKIGEGKLIIKSKFRNYGELNLGGGETVLENEEGVAASVIRLAQGAKLTINRADQISDNNVVFGHRGGTLNLNGTNLEFKDIYHMDKDAKISNEKSDKKSTFTFKPKSDKRVFLGSFKGKLDLVYNPDDNNSEWSIRSEDTNIEGDFNIEKGHVKIEGDNVIHGSDDTNASKTKIYEDEYKEAKFKSITINVKKSSTLSVSRATEVESKINVEKGATLELNLLGKVVTDRPTPYEEAKKEEEINRTVIKGTVDFKNDSKDKDSGNNNFKAKIENNHEAVIEAELKGEVKGIKEGKGLLYLKNDNNKDLKGSIEVTEGKLKIKSSNTLGNAKALLKNGSVLEVDDNNYNLGSLLDKIDSKSEGTLNLNGDISKLDSRYKEFSKLYLSATKDVKINDISEDIQTLNLDANNNTVTLNGLNKKQKISSLNIGNGKNAGIVDINNSDREINAEVNVRSKSILKFSNDAELKKIENSGEILLKDRSLKIEEYKSKNGKINIHLTEYKSKILEIEKTDKDVEASLKLEKKVIDKLFENKEKLDIAKIKERKFKVLNLEQYDSVYRIELEGSEDGTQSLTSTVKEEVINDLYIFNELDLINNINYELKYRRTIEANYINYNKIDKNYSKIENTEYKNSISTNGAELNFEKTDNFDKVIISGGFNFKVLGSKLNTEVKSKNAVNKNFVSVGFIPRLGLKYGIFDINLGLGLNFSIVNNNDKNDTLSYLNNSLNVGINPKFKISDDIDIKYLNRFGYRLNPILSKKISKDNTTGDYEISHKVPINLYYETGLRLEHKYVDFYTKGNVEYNFSSYKISNKGRSIENSFKDDWRVNINMGFEFKPTQNLYINLDFEANGYQKSYGRYIFKTGMGYNW
ncbi:S6 family peptidase [Streptobacillus moniliformis]|uniref:S6 family peptidase n=1 Tax=Streptobacillus moniliformis TaxID=34105 RepID=UPI0007E3452A|nr:S6 family peptidase [Streptobacillus moniliformis]